MGARGRGLGVGYYSYSGVLFYQECAPAKALTNP
jgi:hypothetical protein